MARDYNWRPHSSGHSWYKDSGIRRQEVSGPCFIEPDGTPKYVRKRNKIGNIIFDYVISRHSDFGRFLPPRWDESGQVVIYPGNFITEKTYDGYSLFNSCQVNTPGTIEQLEELNQPQPEPDPTPDPTLSSARFTSISMMDWRIALAIGIGVITLVYAIIVLRKK